MAGTLYVATFSDIQQDSEGRPVSVPKYPALDEAVIALTNSSQTTPTLDPTARYAWVKADGAAAHVTAGTNPTATANAMKLGDGDWIFIGIDGSFKIAARNP